MPARAPLLGTAADQRLFVEDESRERALRPARGSRNVLIIGGPGSGKTSLLNRVLHEARERNRPALMVNGQHVSDSRALIDLLCAAAESESWIPEEKMPASTDPLGPARQLRRLSGVREGAQVLIDDPTREQALGLFGQFRDELWQIPPTFVVAVRPDVADSLSSPPADVFFDDLARLEPFTGRPAEELIRRRLGHTTSPIAIPLDASLEPRALVALAYGEKRPVDLMPARQDLLLAGAEAAAGRAGAMLLAEMWDRGGVSASDRDLQRRLGVTRNRLTELLRALEDGGILHSHPERREGKTGRPRMIYEVASGER